MTDVTVTEVVAGPEVQALVEHSEQVIQALRDQLEVALAEAEDAEQRLASHPAAALLGQGPSDPTEQITITAPGHDVAGAAPRTTVVSRPRVTPAAADGPGAGESSGYQHSASGSGLLRSHLVLKLGVFLAVLAVLLLLFV